MAPTEMSPSLCGHRGYKKEREREQAIEKKNNKSIERRMKGVRFFSHHDIHDG